MEHLRRTHNLCYLWRNTPSHHVSAWHVAARIAPDQLPTLASTKSPTLKRGSAVTLQSMKFFSRSAWKRIHHALPFWDFLGCQQKKNNIWVCLEMGYTVYPLKNMLLNRKNDDKPKDLGVPYFQTNPLEWCLNPSLGASWMRQPAMVGGQRQEFRGFASFTHKTWDVNQKGYGFKWGSALQ